MAKRRWRKRDGTGPFRPHRNDLPEVVRPGDVIVCEESLIEGFLDTFEALDPEPAEDEAVPSAGHVLRRAGAKDQWNVVNEANGQPVTDKPMSRAEAEKLLAKLEQGTRGKSDDPGQPKGSSKSTAAAAPPASGGGDDKKGEDKTGRGDADR
jgi:hypothetical protein